MKQVLNFWSQLSLINRIVIGMIIGILLGIFVPQAAAVGTIGTVFVSALKAIAPLLVFFIVLSALAQHLLKLYYISHFFTTPSACQKCIP